jgi:Mg-chelatase subunit ChlD
LIQRSADKQSQKWVVVFTDGRANVALRSVAAEEDRDKVIAAEMKQLGLGFRKNRVNVVVADTQRQFERSDDPKRLARLLNAQLFGVR